VTWGLVGLGLAAVAAIGPHGWKARAADPTRLVSPFGDDQSGANDCTSPDLPCKTIQQAVNQSGSGDLIELAPGTYTENVTVNQSVTIQGDFINSSIVNGNASGSVFNVQATDTGSSPLTATLSMLTITNGKSGGSGGGIANGGTLTVVQSTISGNTANGGGGGISNNGGTLTIINSTISGNTASQGGGIQNVGTVTLVNTTINANTATGGAGQGGGIFNGGSATLNSMNTIIAGSPSGGDCVNNGTIGTNDHNLVQDGSCSPTVSGDPKLGPLQNNGGPTFTHALLTGSPAIDAGDDAVLGAPFNLSTDQRGPGFPRMACAHVDIGAYEFNAGGSPTVTCPGNIMTTTDPGQTTATRSFTVTASDLCDGALTPTCKIGITPISSPFAFPVGSTTVTCSATNSQGITGTCSFTVTVTLLNGCIQDNTTHDTFRFNTQTGAYVYTRCRDGFTLTGTAMVRIIGNIVTLTDSRPDRRINATFNTSQMTGRAYVTLIPAPGISLTIVVNQTNPHATCTCP
jgi:hypothetical protein